MREEAVKLYKQLVGSPPLRLTPLVLIPYALLLLLDVKGGVLLATAPLAAFITSFGLCSRPTARRLLGLYMYTAPYALAAFAARLAGLNPLYELVNAPLAFLPAGLCGARGLAAYLVYAALAGSIYGLRGTMLSISSALISTAILGLSLGGRGLSYARAAILAWADDNYTLLESVINGVKQQVEWNALIFETEKETIGLVEPGIHYGPFRGVGSSRFPYYLLEASNWHLYPLHGCGSHERNAVSSVESAEYAKRIAEAALNSSRKCTPIKPVSIEAGHWRGFLIGCVDRPFLFATSTLGVEDVPCDAVPLRSSIVFIDMHNFEIDRPRLEHLDALVKKAYTARTPCHEGLLCCWKLVKVDEELASSLNMCSAWLLYLRYACGGESFEAVILPANNIAPEAAKRYQEELEGVNLITIDDHSCAAAIEEGVAPLSYNPRLVEVVNEARRSCRLRSCELRAASGREVLRLWGEETMKEIRQLIRRGLRVRFVPAALYVASLLLTLV